MTGQLTRNELFTDHDILKEIDDAERKARRINRRSKYSREEIDRMLEQFAAKNLDKDS